MIIRIFGVRPAVTIINAIGPTIRAVLLSVLYVGEAFWKVPAGQKRPERLNDAFWRLIRPGSDLVVSRRILAIRRDVKCMFRISRPVLVCGY